MPNAISLNDVDVAFGLADGAPVYRAVAQASLNVADSEFVAIVGPTGCGKSTLLNVAAGLIPTAVGSVSIYGAPLKSLNAEAGYLFQADALFPWKSAIENVAIGLEIAGIKSREAREWLSNGLRASALAGSPLSAHAFRGATKARGACAGSD
jgi:NitT/TauT family transport system ATP-binding protein